MSLRRVYDLTILTVALLLGVCTFAYAYIDPGTASAAWAVGLAPIVAFLGYMGRRVVQAFRRKDDADEGDEVEEEEL